MEQAQSKSKWGVGILLVVTGLVTGLVGLGTGYYYGIQTGYNKAAKDIPEFIQQEIRKQGGR